MIFLNGSFVFSLPNTIMVDTIHVMRNKEWNEEKGIGDFYLARLPSGEVVTEGSML